MQKSKVYKLTLREYKNIFDTLYATLCLFSNKYLNNIEASKDVVQDVFVKIWENKVEFKDENKIKSYLYTAVKNKSLDLLKSKHYKSIEYVSFEEIEKMETESFFLREVVILETSDIVDKAINTLPNKCAQIIRLSVMSLTNVEIATELGISINTVKSQKKIAYKRLKPLLKGNFIIIAYIFNC